YTFVPAGPTIDASGVVTASTGSYTLTASANGCTSASVSVTVNAQPATPATPVISNITHPVCTVSASPNGSFVISNYSASTTYSFIPTTGTVVSGPTATGLVTVTAGSYTVTSTSNGCTSAPVVVVINPLECADIVTVKTDNQTSYVPGQPVTYIITVTNNGPTAATNVNVVDNAPTGTTFTSWSSSNGSGTGNINDTIATLAVGQTVTYTVNVDVPATLLGNLVNTVTVTTTTPDPVPGCTTCTDIDTPNTTLAENDINNTFMNIPVSGSVLTNDSDPQGHTQTVTASTTTTPQGTLVLNANGTYTFTPATGFTGTFVHTYTVCDNGTPQACDTATLTIEVMPNPNNPSTPNDVVANDDTATTPAGQPVTINILSNDFDPNGDTLGTPTIVTPPTNGTFNPVTGVYTPNPGFVG
ncbi:Ig-like domain-containing protein, partial [Flavobacterium facile]|uniref:Ig-like domain-containing protein n=1 Tax=Flavobacterium facile TaxID=2893174 RepID=UPI002E75EF5F